MNRHPHLCVCVVFSLLFSTISQSGFTQTETNPQPWSEYVEKIGPNTYSYLSYPKYYDNMERGLVPVNPNLAPSRNPAWDYEVTQGIWILRVKKDGTFQAEHEGDVFTYKFNSLGTGQGSGFSKFDLGEPDFSHFSVIGDTILWSNVFPDIDLSVRYIHDILKVDVLAKKEFIDELRAEVESGQLDSNAYLTTRFDIPSALIRSLAMQNGRDKDLFAEDLDINNRPIEFFKNGMKVHGIRNAETYAIDDQGKRIGSNFLMNEEPIRTRQTWSLRRNQAGVAEVSAHIGDLTAIQDRDIVIDPSLTFQQGVSPTSPSTYLSCEDSFLYINESYSGAEDRRNYNYGGATEMAAWAYKGAGLDWNETRPIIRYRTLGKKLTQTYIPAGSMVTSAVLTLKLSRKLGGTPASTFRLQPFGIKVDGASYWNEGSHDDYQASNDEVTWNSRKYNTRNWFSGGAGELDRVGPAGEPQDIRYTTAGNSVSWTLNPSIVQGWYNDSWVDKPGQGIVFECIDKMTNYQNATSYYWHSRNATTPTDRPILVVNYDYAPKLDPAYSVITFNGLGSPMPDGPSAPVYLNTDFHRVFNRQKLRGPENT